jgi:hypothetical protein
MKNEPRYGLPPLLADQGNEKIPKKSLVSELVAD